MDLKKLDQEVVGLIDIPLLFDEDGNPTDGFKAVSANSPEYQEAERSWRVTNVRRSARRGRPVDSATEQGAIEVVNSVDKREFVLIAACVKEIYGFTVDGQPAPVTHETLKMIFDKRPTWRLKTLVAIETEQPFTKASSAPGASATSTVSQ